MVIACDDDGERVMMVSVMMVSLCDDGKCVFC